jgi:hypothetical protein
MSEIEIAFKTEIEKIFTNIYVQKRWKKEKILKTSLSNNFLGYDVVSGGEVRVCDSICSQI